MKRAFIVCGPESSGNRLVAAYLARAGCKGEGSTRQPKDHEIDLTHPNLVIIRHKPMLTVSLLREAGYEVRLIVVTREPHALLGSQVDRGHFPTREKAEEELGWHFKHLFAVIQQHPVVFEFLSYESLVLHPFPVVEALLMRCGLSTENLTGEISVDLKTISPVPFNANAKRYGIDTPDVQRPVHGGELVWYPERGYGYYPVPDFSAYDENYWEKYEGYAKTDLGKQINAARLALVEHFLAPHEQLVDIGVGCGSFLQARAPATAGYDVNPVAVRWLQRHKVWFDPYVQAPESISCWDSMEHIPDPAALVSRVRRFVFLAIPLFDGPDHVLRSHHFRRDEHFWYFTHDGLVRWFESLGFTKRYWGQPEIALGRADIHSFVFERS